MSRLRVRLTLAFGLITLSAVLIVALLANREVGGAFRQFVTQSSLEQSPLVTALATYYEQQGSWTGVERAVPLAGATGAGGMGRGMARGMGSLLLADEAGRVLYDGTATPPAQVLNRETLAGGAPIVVRGRTVGYLIASGMHGELPQAAQRFLTGVNRALVQAALVAGVPSVLLGVVMARSLAAPLARLAEAARQIAGGKRIDAVPEQGAAEIVDVARAFNEMAAGLEHAERLRQNLVADIAHELRTPLSVLQGNLRAVLDDVYPLDKTEIAALYDETLLLSRLVADLHELAQAEAGQLQLHTQPTDLRLLVERDAMLVGEIAAGADVTLTVAMPPRLPLVQIDGERVRQVLHNLLANALRHTPAGGHIEVVVEQVERAAPSSPPGQLRVTVVDDGAGIAAADVPHVFERFWKADRARTRQTDGAGLGLAIAKHLVEAQGGSIGVKSTAENGSRFWFTVPVTDNQPSEAMTAPSPLIPDGVAPRQT